MKLRRFYSTPSAAKEIGRSIRSLARIAESLGLHPLVFGSGKIRRRYMWTADHIESFRKHLEASK